MGALVVAMGALVVAMGALGVAMGALGVAMGALVATVGKALAVVVVVVGTVTRFVVGMGLQLRGGTYTYPALHMHSWPPLGKSTH